MYSYHALDYYHHIFLDKMSLDPALLKKQVCPGLAGLEHLQEYLISLPNA
jgi:hypothetical protein